MLFYISGGAVFIWTIIWFVLVYDSPLKHPRISEQEQKYITKSIRFHTEGTSVRALLFLFYLMSLLYPNAPRVFWTFCYHNSYCYIHFFICFPLSHWKAI